MILGKRNANYTFFYKIIRELGKKQQIVRYGLLSGYLWNCWIGIQKRQGVYDISMLYCTDHVHVRTGLHMHAHEFRQHPYELIM